MQTSHSPRFGASKVLLEKGKDLQESHTRLSEGVLLGQRQDACLRNKVADAGQGSGSDGQCRVN